MKNTFNNMIKILVILIIITLIMWIIFYLLTKKDNIINKNKNNTNSDANINIISEELTTIFSYINNKKESDIEACNYLGKDIGYEITSNEDFFKYYGPIIMDCINNQNYVKIKFEDNKNYKIATNTEIEFYKEYFPKSISFQLLKNIYTLEDMLNFNEEEMEELDKYIDNNYYGMYIINEKAEENKINYEIKRIYKNNEYYEIIIKATNNKDIYTGNFKIKVENNHIQYLPLKFRLNKNDLS